MPDPEKSLERSGQAKQSKTTETSNLSENSVSKIYLKAMPIRHLSDLDKIKHEIKLGNILIIKVTPLAIKNVDAVKKAVNELCKFVEDVEGDIARLGEERIVITPSTVRIWREASIAAKEQVPTAA